MTSLIWLVAISSGFLSGRHHLPLPLLLRAPNGLIHDYSDPGSRPSGSPCHFRRRRARRWPWFTTRKTCLGQSHLASVRASLWLSRARRIVPQGARCVGHQATRPPRNALWVRVAVVTRIVYVVG